MSGKTVLLLLVAALAGPVACGRDNPNRIAFDGVIFKSKTKAVDKKVSRADFTSTIYKVSQSVDGARDAARYQGTIYCVTNYGSSRIAWTIGPETEISRLAIVDDTITFRGKCDP
ncbi:hypothetical protein AB9K34_19810 [Sedimentitalea sp. XS_ASV28]|uniref:hypothetical protein n=1 Tax=Sedimentitalea sp. XS_ASV28 TaxID=3241296 RepID=UPI00351980FB